LDAGTVDVAETVVEVEGRLLFGPPKTRAGRRRIGLPRRVVDELALHLRAPGRPTDKEVAARAGRTSASFTLDRYGHLYPESDAALRDRLDAIYTAGQRDQDAAVVDRFQERSRPRRHPRTQGTPPALGR